MPCEKHGPRDSVDKNRGVSFGFDDELAHFQQQCLYVVQKEQNSVVARLLIIISLGTIHVLLEMLRLAKMYHWIMLL